MKIYTYYCCYCYSKFKSKNIRPLYCSESCQCAFRKLSDKEKTDRMLRVIYRENKNN